MTPSQTPHTWFEAVAGDHPIRLGLIGQARTALQAAIALYRVNSSLEIVSQWLGFDPVWQWVEPGAPRPGYSVPAGSPGDQDTPTGAALDGQLLLDLPAALENALPPAPASLAQKLLTPSLPAQLVAARFRLAPDEAGMLEPGGAIMIPESTEAQWLGVLRSPDMPDRPVVIHSPESVQRLEVHERTGRCEPSEAAEPAPQTGLSVELRLGGPLTVPTACLRSEYGDAIDLSQSPANTRVASLWAAGDPVAPLAVGELTPLGCGWAMLISQLFAAGADAADIAPTDDVTLPPRQ